MAAIAVLKYASHDEHGPCSGRVPFSLKPSGASPSTSTPAHSYTSLMVGDAEIFLEIQELFKRKAYDLPLSFVEESPCKPWIRDSAVKTHKGHCLIPSPQEPEENNSIASRLYVVLSPPLMTLHYKFQTSMKGFGMMSEKVAKIKNALRNAGVFTTTSTSCIEGGNCFRFERAHPVTGLAQRVAIVAESSIWLTALAARNKRQFETLPLQMGMMTHAMDFVRAARNLDRLCFGARIALVNAADLEAPTLPDLYRYLPSSLQLKSDYLYALGQVMNDLKVDALLQILPKDFHIDMQMFVSPDGTTVFVDSITMTIALLETQAADPIFQAYLATAKSRETEHSQIEEKNKQKLKACGYKVVEVPGNIWAEAKFFPAGLREKLLDSSMQLDTYHPDYPLQVNFMNGIFLPNGVWLTSGIPDPRYKFLQDAFNAIYTEHMGIEAKIWPLGDRLIPEIISFFHGGIRCATLEI